MMQNINPILDEQLAVWSMDGVGYKIPPPVDITLPVGPGGNHLTQL